MNLRNFSLFSCLLILPIRLNAHNGKLNKLSCHIDDLDYHCHIKKPDAQFKDVGELIQKWNDSEDPETSRLLGALYRNEVEKFLFANNTSNRIATVASFLKKSDLKFEYSPTWKFKDERYDSPQFKSAGFYDRIRNHISLRPELLQEISPTQNGFRAMVHQTILLATHEILHAAHKESDAPVIDAYGQVEQEIFTRIRHILIARDLLESGSLPWIQELAKQTGIEPCEKWWLCKLEDKDILEKKIRQIIRTGKRGYLEIFAGSDLLQIKMGTLGASGLSEGPTPDKISVFADRSSVINHFQTKLDDMSDVCSSEIVKHCLDSPSSIMARESGEIAFRCEELNFRFGGCDFEINQYKTALEIWTKRRKLDGIRDKVDKQTRAMDKLLKASVTQSNNPQKSTQKKKSSIRNITFTSLESQIQQFRTNPPPPSYIELDKTDPAAGKKKFLKVIQWVSTRSDSTSPEAEMWRTRPGELMAKRVGKEFNLNRRMIKLLKKPLQISDSDTSGKFLTYKEQQEIIKRIGSKSVDILQFVQDEIIGLVGEHRVPHVWIATGLDITHFGGPTYIDALLLSYLDLNESLALFFAEEGANKRASALEAAKILRGNKKEWDAHTEYLFQKK